MRAIVSSLATLALVSACSDSLLATYQVRVDFWNHSNAQVQLVVSGPDRLPGAITGSANPALVEPFTTAKVTLTVPGNQPWGFFVLGPGIPPHRWISSDQLRGCRTFELPFAVDIGVGGSGSSSIPSNNCADAAAR